MTIDLRLYGPLATLAGTWQGSEGDDTAPDASREAENTAFREEIIFTPIGPADNHEQLLYVLSYTRTAWRLSEDSPFHLQLGYWLWDAAAKQVMHSFMIPRGLTVLAGGPAEPNAAVFQVSASVGSPIFGICSNPYLDREFKTVRYEAKITIHNEKSFTYEEDTQLQIKGQDSLFHHFDRNRLQKTKEAVLEAAAR